MLCASEVDILHEEVIKALKDQQTAYRLMKDLEQKRSVTNALLRASWETVESTGRGIDYAREVEKQEWDSYLNARDKLSYCLYVVAGLYDRTRRAMDEALDQSRAAKRSGEMAEAEMCLQEASHQKSEKAKLASEIRYLTMTIEAMTPPTELADDFQRCKADFAEAARHHKAMQASYSSATIQHSVAQYDFFCAQERLSAAKEAYRQATGTEAQAEWVARTCKRCGKEFNVHADWEYPPNYCDDCKRNYNKPVEQQS